MNNSPYLIESGISFGYQVIQREVDQYSLVTVRDRTNWDTHETIAPVVVVKRGVDDARFLSDSIRQATLLCSRYLYIDTDERPYWAGDKCDIDRIAQSALEALR